MTREARRLERLYNTKAHGTKHATVMRLLHNHGLEGTIVQLESWGMRPSATTEGLAEQEAVDAVGEVDP